MMASSSTSSSPSPSPSPSTCSSVAVAVAVAVAASAGAAAAGAFAMHRYHVKFSKTGGGGGGGSGGSSKDDDDDGDEDETKASSGKPAKKSQQLLQKIRSSGSCNSGGSLKQKQKQQQQQQQQLPQSLQQQQPLQPPQQHQLPEEMRVEQLSRHELFFGPDGMSLVRNAKVCVVGLGGVGSHCATMLARGGVGTGSTGSTGSTASGTASASGTGTGLLRLVDFDQVTLSSLNRHACATLDDVGTSKAGCLSRYLVERLGLPSDQVDGVSEMFNAGTARRLLRLPTSSSPEEEDKEHEEHEEEGSNNNNSYDYDYDDYGWDLVLDCIDDVPTKAELLTFCLRHRIRVVSCMGAGGKCDFTRLHHSDLRTASRDPLASKLRQTMKKKLTNDATSSSSNNNNSKDATTVVPTVVPSTDWLDDMDRLSIVYSSEQPVVKLADLTESQKRSRAKSEEFGHVDGMRIRVLPVLGPVPAIMGQSLATVALCRLAKRPIENPQTGERVGKNVRNKLFQKLVDRELKVTSGKISVTLDEEDRPPSQSQSQSQSQQQQPSSSSQPSSSPTTSLSSSSPSSSPSLYTGRVEIDGDDVEYLYGVWRNRCAVTGARIGVTLFLARWNLCRPATTDNLVLVSQPALRQMDEKGKVGSVPRNVRRKINERLRSCKDMNCEY